MKIIIHIFILPLFFINTYMDAQIINDSIFKDVLLIEKEAVAKELEDYLIDVVIDSDTENIPIIFNDSRLSKDFMINRLFNEKSLVLITPDWKFYDETAEEASSMEGCIEPATTNIYFQRKYIKNNIITDSIRISGDQPKLVFNDNVSDEDIVFYYMESFGSTCCSRDPKWDIKQRLFKFIVSFESENRCCL